jgi:hypothetical protein
MTRQTLASNRVARLAWKLTKAMLAATAFLLAACPNPPTPPIIPPGHYTPGQSYFGRNNYIEGSYWIPGSWL